MPLLYLARRGLPLLGVRKKAVRNYNDFPSFFFPPQEQENISKVTYILTPTGMAKWTVKKASVICAERETIRL